MYSATIAVYGSASPTAGSPDYQLAYEVGRLLAEHGHTVMTGGYSGVMQAASQGAVEAGGRTLGITSDQIETWRPLKPNPWVQQQHRYPTFRDRLIHLVLQADAAVALPGGVGTLAEIALYWNAMVVEEMPIRPLVLLGEQWQASFQALFSHGSRYINDRQRGLVQFATTPAEAVARTLAALRA